MSYVIVVDQAGEEVYSEPCDVLPWSNSRAFNVPSMPVPGEYAVLIVTDEGVSRFPLVVSW